jgi:hypothetical protein
VIDRNFTNQLELPEWVVRGLTYSNYNKEGVKFDISCTTLIDGPLKNYLYIKNREAIVEEASEMLWSVYGTAVHNVFEKANEEFSDVIVEKRFVSPFEVKNYTFDVSCQIDCFEIESKILWDIKNMSVWAIVKQDYSKFEKQLNVNCSIMRHHGHDVKKLYILGICRDWARGRAGERNYPSHPIQVLSINRWSNEEQDQYIKDRLVLHMLSETGEETPAVCSDEERWYTGSKHAIMRKNKVKAVKLCDTEEEAEEYIESLFDQEGVYLQYRPGSYRRCESYCNVSEFCPTMVNI